MEKNKWNILVYLHAALFLWFIVFLVCLFIPDRGKAASVFASGNILFLFLNIPFALVTLILRAKGRFSGKYDIAVVLLSILNIVVGIVAWLFIVLLLQKP